VSQVTDLATRLRAADDRVAVVERRLLAARLGLAGDDLELLLNATVTDLLELPASVTLTLGAARLLAELDARDARAHPVDLEHLDDVLVATVLTGDERRVTAALQPALACDPLTATVLLEVDDREVLALDADDAEDVAYALLRLAREARDRTAEDVP